MGSTAGEVIYDYTTGDRPQRMTAPGGVVLDYTFNGNLLSGLLWSGPVPGNVTHAYDALGRAASRRVNGVVVNYGYNADSLLTRAGDLLVDLDPATGWPVAERLGRYSKTGPGLASASGRPSPRHQAGRSFSPKTIHLMAMGASLAPLSRSWVRPKREPTDMIRLTAWLQCAPAVYLTAEYTYDPNGNRLTAFEAGSGTRTATYDAQDRLISLGGDTYTYDAAGDLQAVSGAAGMTMYDFDALGNLRSVGLPGGRSVEYLIDGANRRVGKRVNGALVGGFLWQDRFRVAAELDASGNIVSQFVYTGAGITPAYEPGRDKLPFRGRHDREPEAYRECRDRRGGTEVGL